MAAVATSLLPLSLPLCRKMTYHVWYEDSVMEQWKNNNKPMRRMVILWRAMKKRCGHVSAPSRLFWQFFLGTYCLLGSLQAKCWIMEMKNKMVQTWGKRMCHGVCWWYVSISTACQPFQWLANSFQSILIHFDSFWFSLIQFDSVWFILIHFDSFWFISIHFNSLQFTSIHFNSFWFILIHFDPFWSILIYFNPDWSILIYFNPDWNYIKIAKTFQSYSSHFDPFWIATLKSPMVSRPGILHTIHMDYACQPFMITRPSRISQNGFPSPWILF
jgi:hypothetical protein